MTNICTSHAPLRQRGLRAVERRVDLRADGRDRADADHNNQGQHDGVLNSGRAVFRREEFRHHSYVSLAARAVICGLGAAGYRLALEALAEILGTTKEV